MEACLGFGTMEWPDRPPSDMTACVALALEAGYTSFDCAESYATTVATGAALAKVHRTSVFITTKLSGMPHAGYAAFKQRVVNHLGDLQIAKANLILLHWPGPADLDLGGTADAVAAQASWSWFDAHIDESWLMMNRLVEEGLCDHIGTSNFYQRHLERLGEGAQPTARAPFANEIFVDVSHPQFELVEFCDARAIRTIAYRALSFIPVLEMVAAMGDSGAADIRAAAAAAADDDRAAEGGSAEGSAAADVDLRAVTIAWLASRSIHALVKSGDAAHLATNLAAARSAASASESTRRLYAAKAPLFARRDMVDMCGGCDEFAAAFERVSVTAADARRGDAGDGDAPSPVHVAALERALSVDGGGDGGDAKCMT